MANQLKMAEVQAVLALARGGWSNRHIARHLGVHRETVGRHLRLLPQDNSKPASAPIGSEALSSGPGGAPLGSASAPAGFVSAARAWREVIVQKLEMGLTTQRIYQDPLLRSRVLLRRIECIGPHATQWAQCMLQNRGIKEVRALMGLLSLTNKHRRDQIEHACQIAQGHGANHLRSLRQLIEHRSFGSGTVQQKFASSSTPPSARNQTDEVYASQHWLVLSAPRWSVLARPATPTGITSSAAQTNSTSYGIGYADFADANNPAGLSSGQIEIKYTLLGDANLDGVA
jgi:hypothetical protein